MIVARKPEVVQLVGAVSSDADMHKRKKETTQSVLSPEKLLLYGKALHKIVESRCSAMVDDLGLDTFQAYLNRQLLKGPILTLRQPLHFNVLYQSLTGCANFLTDNKNPASSSRYYGNDRNDDVGRRNERSNSHPETQKNVPKLSSLFVVASAEEFPASTAHPSDIQQQSTKRGEQSATTPASTLSIKSPEEASAVASKQEDHPSWTQDATMLIDKLAFNASMIASTLADTTRSFLSELADKTSSLFRKWVGRKKRSIKDTPPSTHNITEDESPYYKKMKIIVPPEIVNSSTHFEEVDNYPAVWKSVAATEMRMTSYLHFSRIFRSIVSIALNSCPTEFPVHNTCLTMISGLMLSQVTEDLMSIENEEMYLKINERLEASIKQCANEAHHN